MSERKMPYDLFGVECGKGWATLYEPVLALAAAQGASVLQVKEKWGMLRIYVAGGDRDLERAIDDAEQASAKMCERCGAAGQPRRGGWISAPHPGRAVRAAQTLCDACAGDPS